MPRTCPSHSGADDGVVAAGPEQRAGAHHHDQRDGDAQLPAAQMPLPSTDLAQMRVRHHVLLLLFVLVAGIGDIILARRAWARAWSRSA